MSRGGTSGKGGRNYRLNWKDFPQSSEHGKWKICSDSRGWRWYVWRDRQVVLRGYGRLKFVTRENAKRWVERHIRRSRPA